MRTVALALFAGARLFDVAVASEVWAPRRSEELPAFELRRCAATPAPVLLSDGAVALPERTLAWFEMADLVIVPGMDDPQAEGGDDLITALRAAHRSGKTIAALCAGAFVLAAAGLLDGRPAITHWALCDDLARRYPLVSVKHRILFTGADRVWSYARPHPTSWPPSTNSPKSTPTPRSPPSSTAATSSAAPANHYTPASSARPARHTNCAATPNDSATPVRVPTIPSALVVAGLTPQQILFPSTCDGLAEIAEAGWVTMARRAATTRVPGYDKRPRDAANAADERPGQGCGNSRPPSPDHGAAAPTAWGEGAVRPLRPGLPRGAAAPTPPPRVAAGTTAGPPRDRPAVASRPGGSSPCGRLPSQTGRPSAHGAVHPQAGATPGTREQLLGIPAHPRRTARAGCQSRRVHRLGAPPRGGHRPGPAADVGQLD